MESVKLSVRIIALLLVILAVTSSRSVAGQSSLTDDLFIDLDGDGINDNASDKDGDGIPDKFAGDALPLAADTLLVGGSAFQFDSAPIGVESNAREAGKSESNSKRFASLRMSVRALGHLRGGIKSGDDFGAGAGADNLTVKGVTCVGGVCH